VSLKLANLQHLCVLISPYFSSNLAGPSSWVARMLTEGKAKSTFRVLEVACDCYYDVAMPASCWPPRLIFLECWVPKIPEQIIDGSLLDSPLILPHGVLEGPRPLVQKVEQSVP
jgi:hypothetical protein